jgi:hypothetical protein
VINGYLLRVCSEVSEMPILRSSSLYPARLSRLSIRCRQSAHPENRPDARRGRLAAASVVGIVGASLVLVGTAFVPLSSAATTVNLGTVAPFAVLGASEVTNVPTSSITGDVGLSPAAGSLYSGVTQLQVHGAIYSTNAAGPLGSIDDPGLLTKAQQDLTSAFVIAQNQPATTTYGATDNQLGGKTLTPGVYDFGAAPTADITAASPLVLNGNGIFIFNASSTLITAAGSVVRLEGGAQACNVFWTVDSSATLGSGSTFVGTLMALTSATLDSTATVQGRILAQNAAVTLDANTITVPTTCLPATVPPTTTTTTPVTTTSTTPVTTTPTTTTGGSGGTGTGGTGGAGGTGATGGGSGGTAAGSAGSVATTASSTGTGSGTSGAGGTTGSGATGTGGTGVVPVGFPHTGLGGAAHARDNALVVLGALAMAGAALTATLAVRRRRISLAPVRISEDV